MIHEHCLNFWEETLFISCCLAHDLVISKGEAPDGVLGAVHHSSAASYCVPLSRGAAGCAMALLPREKHTKACSCIIRGKIQPSSD